ncbi:predicted hydrolase or acyltransferase [Microbacterium testaceum StLB037]|uniref:Predicted hydrolase or acyltransferase n=1 Tax=Microbacterium testaceum (strain StLB037) TaxID=979556 RepID=E8NED3_MICTS|nr:alpha/beta hydrolase [Microbacterium testaceum]BAJ73799.1 predicted hydrolase or acyltransferase [Microbacterium testaceum StLB037]
MSEITAHHGLLTDIDLHVDDTGGDGRPVVLLHGWPLSGESWAAQVPALESAGYRVVTYDRRGFGRSDKPRTGYDYDTFSDDLEAVLAALDLRDVTLVGFSMGGGEVARYLSRHGADRIRSVVFAAAVPPYLAKTEDNPDGPLDDETADGMKQALKDDEDAFYRDFTTGFFSVDGELKVTEADRAEAERLAHQADHHASLKAMEAWATTDFREDLSHVTVPTLIIHGDSDATVPLEGSGARTHAAIPGSELHVVTGAPHGVNVSHADEFNSVLLDFLRR